MIKVEIPGKVMLSGEYAVLHGGTAVLTPVPYHLIITQQEEDSESDFSPVVRQALDFEIPELKEFEDKAGKPNLKINSEQFYSVDFNGNRVKLGIGLSAAEAVGVVAFRFQRAGINWTEHREMIADYADRIHRQAQANKGSGADIAACAYGEPIRFKRIDDKLEIEPIEINSHLPLKLVWTGQPSNTREMVSKFESWLDQGHEDELHELIEASDSLVKSWSSDDIESLFEHLDSFDNILEHIAESANIPLKLNIHREIEKWARDHGGRAKPTGAGAGDLILLIGDLEIDHPEETVISLSI